MASRGEAGRGPRGFGRRNVPIGITARVTMDVAMSVTTSVTMSMTMSMTSYVPPVINALQSRAD